MLTIIHITNPSRNSRINSPSE